MQAARWQGPQLQRQQAGRTRCARMADDKAMDAETAPDTGNERATPMDSSPQPSAEVSSPVHRGVEAAHKPAPASVQRPAHQQPPPHPGSGLGGPSHASVKLSTGAGTCGCGVPAFSSCMQAARIAANVLQMRQEIAAVQLLVGSCVISRGRQHGSALCSALGQQTFTL